MCYESARIYMQTKPIEYKCFSLVSFNEGVSIDPCSVLVIVIYNKMNNGNGMIVHECYSLVQCKKSTYTRAIYLENTEI